MKKGAILAITLIILCFPLVSWTGDELTATWDPNTEADMSHYNLYWANGGNYVKINDEPIVHPMTSYTFRIELPDDSRDALCFVVTAVDSSGNESDYSEGVCVD